MAETKTQRLKEKITALRQRMQDMREIEARLKEQPDGHISLQFEESWLVTQPKQANS